MSYQAPQIVSIEPHGPGQNLFSHVNDYTNAVLAQATVQEPTYLFAQVLGSRDEIRASIDLIHEHNPNASILFIGHDAMPGRTYFVAHCSESCQNVGLRANDWIRHIGSRCHMIGGGTGPHAEGHCPLMCIFSQDFNNVLTSALSFANVKLGYQ